jgi:L-ribulose-5-phosphate 3-epimerase
MMTGRFQRLGMMQGRLSPIRNRRIQSFPFDNWKEEIAQTSELSIGKVEWTIDSEDFQKNPLVSISGCEEISAVISKWNVSVPSVTCDYFMENPPWKSMEADVYSNLISIIKGMERINSKLLVIPLVDNSSLKTAREQAKTKKFFSKLQNHMIKAEVHVAFETDLNPENFNQFMADFDPLCFYVNYDIGNSASLGYKPKEEVAAIGDRIANVHVKDRNLHGSTVPLGEGAANFPEVFNCLAEVNYKGNYILQTARAKDGNHARSIVRYRDQVAAWLEENS